MQSYASDHEEDERWDITTYKAYFENYHNTFQVPAACFNSLLNEKQGSEPNEIEALRSYENALSMHFVRTTLKQEPINFLSFFFSFFFSFAVRGLAKSTLFRLYSWAVVLHKFSVKSNRLTKTKDT